MNQSYTVKRQSCRLRSALVAVIALLATYAPARGDDDPCGGRSRLLATLNRPTVGYSACAVYPGTAIFELGYQNQQSPSQSQSQYPQSFLRLGLRPRFELDVIGPNEFKQGASAGAADSGLGVKYELRPAGKFTLAIDGLYTGPNGSSAFSAGNATVTGNFDLAYALNATTGLGTTIAVSSTGAYDPDGFHGRYGLVMPSFVITKQLRDNYQLYTEYVYSSKLAPHTGGRAFLDYGVQKLLNSRLEFDVELGHSITPDRALSFSYWGAGLGIQIGAAH